MHLSDGLVRPSCGAAGAECLGGLTTHHRSCVCHEAQRPVARGEAENKAGHAVGQRQTDCERKAPSLWGGTLTLMPSNGLPQPLFTPAHH